MISEQKIKEWVDLYLAHIKEITLEVHAQREEGYKFKAVDHFQKNFDLTAGDLEKMLEKSIEQSNLVAGANYLPRRAILVFAREQEQEIRKFFTVLYDEQKDIAERLNNAQEIANGMVLPSSRDRGETHHSHSSLRFLSLLAAFRYPDKYNAIKPREWKQFCRYVNSDFDIPNGSLPGEQYRLYSEHIEKLREYIKELPEIDELRKKLTSGLTFHDDEFRWITQDVIYVGARNIEPEPATLIEQSSAPQKVGEDAERAEDESITEKLRFVYEGDLEFFIIDNWESIDFGEKLEIFIDSRGEIGQQYPTDVGPIDVLAVDKNGNFVVIELKRNVAADEAVAQLGRYMQWVEENLAKKSGKTVRGILIAHGGRESLRSTIKSLRFPVEVKLYNLKLELGDM